jgi:hypothetical protein
MFLILYDFEPRILLPFLPTQTCLSASDSVLASLSEPRRRHRRGRHLQFCVSYQAELNARLCGQA